MTIHIMKITLAAVKITIKTGDVDRVYSTIFEKDILSQYMLLA